MSDANPFHRRFGADVAVPLGLDDMAGRGVCRLYAPEALEPALLQGLSAVALSAPSKSDLQQRDILIVADVDLRARIDGLFPDMPWIAGAPHFLVFLANNRRQRQIHEWRGHAFANDHLDAFFNAAVDAGIAMQAFVTAAERLGLGCCPISAIRNHAERVHEWFGLPDHVFPVVGLTVGKPLRPPRVSPRLPLEATLHVDRFEDGAVRAHVEAYDARRAQVQPYGTQRDPERFDAADPYTWSEDKARQYAVPERAQFGAYARKIGFKLD